MLPPASTWPEQPPVRRDRSGETTTSVNGPRGQLLAQGPSGQFTLPSTIGDLDVHLLERSEFSDATRELCLLDDPTMPEAPTAKAMHDAEVRRLLARGARLWSKLVVAVPIQWRGWQRTIARVSARLPPSALLLGALVTATIVIVALGWALSKNTSSLDGQEAIDAIFAGKANDVVDELEDVAPADRSLEQDLVLGHAHAALAQDERALELYRVALPLHADVFALAVLVSRLDASAPDEEIDLLVLWPDQQADDLLSLLTIDPRRRVRANATAILVERDGLGFIDVEHSALLDFVQAQGCGERRIALATLRVAGKSQGALQQVDRIGRAFDSCFAGSELRSAYVAIKSRLGDEQR